MTGIFYMNPPGSRGSYKRKEPRLVDADPDDNPAIDKPPLIGRPEYDNLPQRIIESAEQGIQRVNVFRPGSHTMIDFTVSGDIKLDRRRVLLKELVFNDLVGNYHSSTIGQLEQVVQEKVSKFTNTKAQRSKKTLFGFEYSFCTAGIDRINISCSQDSNGFVDLSLSASGHPIQMEEKMFRNMAGYIIHGMVNSRP